MNGLLKEMNVDVFNLQAISCLEEIGILHPTQKQIDTVEDFLRRAGQIGKGRSRFTRTFMRVVVNENSYINNNQEKGHL